VQRMLWGHFDCAKRTNKPTMSVHGEIYGGIVCQVYGPLVNERYPDMTLLIEALARCENGIGGGCESQLGHRRPNGVCDG
jgi:hypothetical protein